MSYSPRTPFYVFKYISELDTSVLCDNEQTTYFQNMIGMLQWIVELDQIDISFKVSLISKFLALLCTGHLIQVLHIFKYLDTHKENDLNFDPMYYNPEVHDVVNERFQANNFFQAEHYYLSGNNI